MYGNTRKFQLTKYLEDIKKHFGKKGYIDDIGKNDWAKEILGREMLALTLED